MNNRHVTHIIGANINNCPMHRMANIVFSHLLSIATATANPFAKR